MSCFGDYGRYYDLLYRDRDYAAEAQALSLQLARHLPDANALLELGCGTGRLARELAGKGYALHGVDLSEEMLQNAHALAATLSSGQGEKLSFTQGDARSARVGSTFDAVFALFHVMSYQQTNADLEAVLATAAAHLKPGGLFLFDFWYGPAVLCQRPELRVKRCEDEAVRLVRIAEPVMRFNENLVEVHYQILAVDKKTRLTEELREVHTMRYLYLPELQLFLDRSGFGLVDTIAWPSGGAPDESSWGVACVARKL